MAEVAFVDTKTFTSTTLPTKALHLPLHLLAASLITLLRHETYFLHCTIKYIPLDQQSPLLPNDPQFENLSYDSTILTIERKKKKRENIYISKLLVSQIVRRYKKKKKNFEKL